MDRGKEEIKYVPRLIFPDLPIILKLGRLTLVSRERSIKRTLDPRNKDNKGNK